MLGVENDKKKIFLYYGVDIRFHTSWCCSVSVIGELLKMPIYISATLGASNYIVFKSKSASFIKHSIKWSSLNIPLSGVH